MTRFEVVSNVLQTAISEPYKYGSNDCFFLGLKTIDALTGTQWVKHYSGAYKTLLGANRALRRRGHASLVDLYRELVLPIAWGRSRIGDVAVIEVGGVEHIAVHGGQSWHSITEAGHIVWPLDHAKQAFEV